MHKDTFFPLVTSHISLDLVNTEVIKWGTKQDLLTSETIDDFFELSAKSNINLDFWLSSYPAYNKEELLSELIELRATLRKHFEYCCEKNMVDVELISFLENNIAAAPISFRIVSNSLVAIPKADIKNALKSIISLDCLQMIASGDFIHLKRCHNQQCILLFIDKLNRRKWCSMQICGNRNKVKKHNSANKKK